MLELSELGMTNLLDPISVNKLFICSAVSLLVVSLGAASWTTCAPVKHRIVTCRNMLVHTIQKGRYS